ncbi:MAG: sodium/glucose cotransporter, partial [Rhodothermales bacterium]|nr:sodium/glucose cotransporter [Rhodothermales bacterium]
PLVVVIPGIVAYAMNAPIQRGDEAYPWLLGQYLGPGIKGLAFAALVAAVVSSLASMMNSTATIFTIDLYKGSFRPEASERQLVRIGRVVSLVCIVIGAVLAPQLARLDQAFQYIQEYTGFISPGVLAIFMLGLFWKKATPNAALVSALLSIPLSAGMKLLTPGVPFIDRMGIVFLVSVVLIVLISYFEGKGKDHPKAISLSNLRLVADPVYNVAAFGILGITVALYAMFW